MVTTLANQHRAVVGQMVGIEPQPPKVDDTDKRRAPRKRMARKEKTAKAAAALAAAADAANVAAVTKGKGKGRGNTLGPGFRMNAVDPKTIRR